jgi:hypothetical protein
MLYHLLRPYSLFYDATDKIAAKVSWGRRCTLEAETPEGLVNQCGTIIYF